MGFNSELIILGDFPALTSIGIGTADPDSFSEIGDSVSIVVEENPKLILCSWVENFLPDGIHAVRGGIYIQNNATGCKTTEEISNPVLIVKDRIFVHKDSTTTSFNIFASVRWQLVTSDDATWITSLSSDSSTHSSRITGENEATITLMYTRAPDETPRSTTLTLTPINEEGNELTNPTSMTIHVDQSPTVYKGDITLSSQEEVDEFISNTTVIDGNLYHRLILIVASSRSDITDLSPLSNLTHITGYVWIQQNGQLDNINALTHLQSIGGDFSVGQNSGLTDLGDFPVLQTIGENFSVNNNSLTDLGDFPALQTIGGYFNVQYNALTDLGDFPVLQSIGGYFQVREIKLTDLGDFPILQTIGGYFYVYRNDSLTDLGDFSVLQTIGGYFYVESNNELTDLGDFPVLQTIGGSFNVSRNSKLTDLGDFPVLQSIGEIFTTSIRVVNNSSLSDCSVLIDFLPGGTHAVSGGIYINNNAGGCNSGSDIIDKTTYTGDIIVTTQAAVDVLRTTLAGKIKIDGNLIIGRSSDITDLTPLSSIVRITGNLGIQQNGQLVNLNGLTHLQTIGGYFYVRDNSKLTDLGDFPDLQTIGGNFRVYDNDQLRTLGDFSTLTSVGIGSAFVPSLGESRDSVSIVVERNSNLLLCSWLENFLPDGIHAVRGDIYINNNATGCETTEEIKNPVLVAKDHIFVHTDSTTTSFNIYSNVRWQLSTSNDTTWITSLSSDSSTHTSRITGESESTITLMHTRAPDETPRSTTLTLTAIDEEGNELVNPATITINLTQLSTFYEGNITLSSQEEVDEFVSNTTVIDGNLTIGYTDFGSTRTHITDLSPLSNINHITGYVWIQQNGQLVNLNALTHLQIIGGYFSVNRNNELTDLGDFSVLRSIGGNFYVESNSELTDLGDFPVLQTIGGYFQVDGNSELTDLGDFSILRSIGENFYVQSNSKLADLGDFSILQTIGGYFYVESNNELTDLGDFSILQTIGGYFYVESNNELTDLGDFSILQTIGGYFRVTNNDTLTSLGNFPALTSIGTGSTNRGSNVSIVVEYNSRLSDCYTLTEFLPGGDHAVSGGIYINNNALGCSSGDEIISGIPHTIMLTSHTNGESIAIAYDEVVAQTIMFSIGGGATGWTSDMTGDDFITLDPDMNVAQDTGVAITVRATPTKNTGVERSAAITITTTGGGPVASATVTITQAALPDYVYLGDITVTTQAEVDSLRTTLAGKTRIDGNLTIEYSYDITNLTPLSSIVRITENLTIQQNGSLVNLDGLTHLQTVGGYLIIGNNTELQSLGDFSALTSIGSGNPFVPSENAQVDNVSILVEGNPNLFACCNLANFLPAQANAVSGRIFINNNSAGCNLATTGTDAEKAAALSSVCGTTTFTLQSQINTFDFANATAKNIVIGPSSGSDPITNISRLSTITSLLSLTVTGNEELQNLIGLSAFTQINGNISVENNPKLQSLGDFSALTRIGGELNINNNEKLQSLGNFPALTSIGEFFNVSFQPQLTTLGDFPVLRSIEEYFSVQNNDTLTTLGNFPSLTSIGVGSITVPSSGEYTENVSIVVEDNSSLSDCYTLTEFIPGGSHAVSGEIYINDNAGVCTNQNALSNTIYRGDITVTTQAEVDSLRITLAGKTGIDGNLTIGYTDYGSSRSDITDLSPLGSIVRITGNVWIQQNRQLVNLNALTHLQTIGGFFGVGRNDSLTDLGNFPVLQTIGKFFYVGYNAKLTTLGNFPVLETIEKSFRVDNNGKLTDLGDFPVLQTIGGYFYVSGNSELTDLGDFPALTSIGVEEVYVLSEGRTIDSVSIVVESNSSLSDCYVLTEFLTGGDHAVSGGIYINNNALGCNSGDEIKASAPHTIMLTSHTDGESIAIAYDEVVAQTIMFGVGGGATGWTSATTGDDFITLDPDMNVAQDTGVAITVRATPTENTGVERSTAITFTTTGGTGAVASATVTVTQEAAPPTLVVATNDTTIDHNSGALAITFTLGGTAVGWTGEVIGDDDFITLNPAMSTSDTDQEVTIMATYEANTGEERKDTITITTTGDGIRVSKKVTITQEVAPPALIRRVTTGGDSLADGSTWAAAMTLQAALAASTSPGDQVWIAAGTYRPHATDRTATFSVPAGVLVYGGFAGNEAALANRAGGATILSGDLIGDDIARPATGDRTAYNATRDDNSLRVVTIAGANVTLDGLTITAGQSGDGAGLYSAFANMTVVACTFSNNEGSTGAGARFAGTATLTSCTFTNNFGTFAGGGHFSGAATLTGCTFVGNVANNGGGATFNAAVTLVNCTFANNHADQIGGGVRFLHGGTVINSTFYNNTVGNFGGGIIVYFNTNNPFILQNSILIGNRVFSVQNTNAANIVTLQNNLIAGGAAGIGYSNPGTGVITEENTTDQSDASVVFASTDAMNANYLRLKTGSPAVNAGNNAYLNNGTPANPDDDIKTDAEGNARIQGGTVDLGAYESDPLFHTGDITVTTQAEVDALRTTLAGKTRINGNLTIGSSSDITDLTPLSNIGRITGYLDIQQNGVLVNLDGLDSLQSIGGYFRVWSNSELTDVGDFSVLQTIGGYFQVNNNDSLTDLGGFPVLQTIGGYFRVQSNDSLTDLGDFPVLQSIGGYFRVNSNSELTDLGDFPVLQTIGGVFVVVSNSKLTDLGDFPVLQSVGGDFRVFGNNDLTDVGDFPVLQSIGGYFYVNSNNELTDLGDFPALTSIGVGASYVPSLNGNRNNVSILVEDNSSLFDCYTLTDFLPGGVHAVSGGIFISNNALGCNSGGEIKASAPHTIMLTSHTDGDSIAIAYDEVVAQTIMFSIGGSATGWTSEITGDDFITLDPFANVSDTGVAITVRATPTDENTGTDERSAVITLTTMGGIRAAASARVTITQAALPDDVYIGDITVSTQAEVDSLRTTLAGKTVIDGKVLIGYGLAGDTLRSDITDLTPLSNVSHITGNLIIQRNGSLVNLNGLTHLQTIGGNFRIGAIFTENSNAQLTALGDFSVLQTIGGYFSVQNNDTLTDLGDFPALQTIGGFFYVYSNAQLTALGGFPVLRTVGEYFNVYNNAQLTALGDFPVLRTVGEYFNVYNNAQLTALGDFPVLRSIGEYFNVTNNDTLTALGKFPALTSIGVGSITVPSLDEYTEDVSILVEDNSSLSDCYTLTDLLPGGSHAVSGGIYINNNALGCSSGDEIIVSAPHTIKLISHTDGDSIAIAYNDVDPQIIMFSIGGGATGWTSATTGDDFITLDPFANVSDTGVAIMVRATPTDENTGVARSAVITLTTMGGTGVAASARVTITQLEAPSSHILKIISPSGASDTVAYTATTDSDSVEIVFTVGNALGWESMISYGAGADEFITLSETDNAAQVGDITIKAAVTKNEGVERSAVITLMTRGGTGAPATATVMITQDGAPPTIRLISKNREALAYDETTETAIMFEVGGGATGWRSSIAYIHGGDFITLDTVMNANQTGDVTVRATPMDNTGVERTAVITFTTRGGTGVATTNIIIIQESVPTIALSTSRDIHIAYNEVSAQLLIFDIGGSATGWIASSDQDLVTLNNEIGDLGTGIEVLVTPTINNGVSPRTATITISTTGQLGAGETATVMLTQGSAPASPVLVPLSFTDGDSISISYDETTETAIMFEVGGGATGWRVSSSNEDFITINPSMGAPGQDISVTATPEGKNMGVERMAVITLSTLGPESTSLPVTATLTIVQDGAPPVLSLTSEVRDTLAYDAQTASDITFTLGGGATGWSHDITYSGTSEAFLTLTGDTTMSGEVRVGVASKVNMGMERTATITIKTEGGSGDALDTMITIVQEASPPVLRLISSHREVIAHDRITAKNIIFDVGGGATGWEVSVEDDNNFLTVDRTMGVPGENIAVVARSRGLNAGVERRAVVRIRAMRGVGAVVDTFVTITQMGAVPTLSVGNSGGNIAYNSTEATINFSIGGGATGWRVSSIRSQVADENFITSPEVGEIRNVRGDQRLSVTLEENRGLQRLAVITLETVGGTSNAVSADFLILQDAAPPTLRLTSSDSAFISHDVTRLSDITFEVGGGATGWRAEAIEGNDFLTLSNDRGSSGLGRIRVDVRNNLGLSRTGRISIRTVGGTGSGLDTVITIRQGSAPPTLTLTSLDREDLAYDVKKAGDITFNLGGGATGWSSEITYSEGSEAFLTLTGEEDKRGEVKVVVASKVNTGMERTATVTIKTEGGSGDALDTMITIVQELVPTISVTTSQNISIAYDEDLPQTITFEVGGSATGWTASSDQDFVSLSPMSGDSGSNIKVEVTSTINNGSARTATITFLTTGQLGSSATAEVTLLQGAINIAVTTQAEVNGLTTILAGATMIDGNLTIGDVEDSTSSRSDITDLTPLRKITHITGNLIIASNGRLSDLRSLTGLQSIGGSLSVINNDSLSTLGDFTRLHSIGGALSVTGNDTLEALGNFSVLTNLGTGRVWVPSQDKKVSNTSIVVSNNPFLSLCSTLEEFLVGGVRAVGGGVYIDNNSVGCNSSQDIQTSFIGHIIVVTQAEVNALRVNLLGKTIIKGNLIIGDIYGFSSQNDITDLTPLRNITHITGNLIVAQNEQLVHLTGIHNLATIGGYFLINSNDQLITLGEFPSLTHVGVGTSFVSSLNERKNDVSILVENNPGLSNCCALESFLDREKNKTEGEIYIMNNSTGCNNTAEVALCNFIPPVIISLTKDSVSENLPLGTTVGVFSITGGNDSLDVSRYVYELEDDAAGLFTLFGDTLKTAKVFDFEIEKSYLITLMTHHPDEGKFYDSIFTLTIRNVNEPPTALSLTNVSVSENLPSGTVVGRLSTVDDDIKNDVGDAGDFHTYTLGGVEGGLFSIQDDNELVTSASFDFEAKQSYAIDITTRDVGGLVWTQAFTILVTDSNDAPTGILLSNHVIAENSDVGTAIGGLITTDQDDPENNDTYIYTLKGTFFDIFQIVDDTLKTKISLNYEEQSSYEVQITTEDGQGGIYDTTLVISVKDVNDVPIGIDITNNLFPENASMGTLVGVLTTMDEDDTVHTYELGDDVEGLFTLFGDTLKTARGFNFEDRSLYTIEITTRDADTAFTQDLIIEITDENDAPTFVIISNHVIAENAEPGVVGFLTALDEDADDQHVYFLSGAGVVPFTISGNRLFSTERLDYEEQSSYEIFIKARDQSDAESDTIPFIINITNVNEPPTAVSLTDTMVSENVPLGTVIGRLTTTDDDRVNGAQSNRYIYTLGGTDSLFFAIANGNELVTNGALNFEEKSSYAIMITTEDFGGNQFTWSFNIIVKNENDSPTDIALSANVIAENQVSDTLIGVLSSTDPDVGDFHTYSLKDDSDTFQIVGNELQSKLPLNYETNPRPVITIISNDGQGGIFEKDFTLEVTDVNDAPTAITLSNDTINENEETGTVIGIFNSMDEDDPNMDSVYTYTLGDTYENTFQIVGNQLQTKVPLNYEEKLSYTIQITTDDGQGGMYSDNLIIRVYNINDAPTAITLSNHAIDENVSIGSTIGTLQTVDEDENENHHYVLSGIDGGSFRIVGNNRLATNDLFDYEKDSSYTISITTQDHGGSRGTERFTITVKNVNEKPTKIILDSTRIVENSAVGAVIGTLSTLDPDDTDNNDTYTYTINAALSDTFQIVGDTLQVKIPLNYEEKRRYTLSITTRDNGDSTLTEDFIITVENANDTLPSITLTRDSVAENQKGGTVIGVLSSVNGGMNNEYSSDNSLFTISKDTLKTFSRLDYEEFPNHYVTITTDDGQGRTFLDDFLIKVTNENDRPTDIELNADSIEENIEGRVVIGTVRTVDQDINDEHVYTVDNTAFSFDGNKLITRTPFDYEVQDSDTIVITSTDGIDEVLGKFTIYVADVNDAPSAIQLINTSVAENTPIGTLVGTLSTIDDDLLGGNPRGDTHLYRLVNDNDSESKFFRISGDRLEIDTTFNYEIQSSYDLVLVTTDRAGASLQQSFTITIEDVNDVPTSLSLSNDVVKEKEEAYTVIGILSTEDEDDLNMDSVYTYSVNNDTFKIDNDTLKTNRELDFETQSEYLVAITTVDGRGGTRTEDFTLKVSNVNEPPTAIQLTDTSVAENNPSDTLIGILSTTDEDLLNNNKSNDTHSYTLVEDTDKNIFRIQADTLKTKVRFNYEQRANYPISILVTDKEGSTHIESFTIAIQDRNDAPMDISLSKNTVTENEAIGTVIGILSTDDEDDPNMDSVYTYSVNNEAFNIAHDTLKTNRILDFERQSNYDIGITVEDGEGGDVSKNLHD